MICYMLVWSGGYEDNQYSELKTDESNALLEASVWVEEAGEGEQVDVLEINTDTLSVSHVKSYWKDELGDVIIS